MSILIPVKRTSALPWAGFGDLEQHFDRLFGSETPASQSRARTWVPPVDIHETDAAYILEADLPGMTKDDIAVTIHEDRITLKGSRKREAKNEEKGYRRYERADGTFERSFRINGGVDAAHVEATFTNGVLTITLPKPEESKPKQVEVKVN